MVFFISFLIIQGQCTDICLNQSAQQRIKEQMENKKTKYLKKNTESNISNQILSFLCNKSKSGDTLIRVLKHLKICQKQIVNDFYSRLKTIRSEKKKYINKKKILDICIKKNTQTEEYSELSATLFRKLIRILIKIFLTQFCPCSILTSRKLNKEASVQHLERRRQIYKFLMDSYTVQ